MTTTKIIAFVDILGFSKMIEDYDNGNHQILESLIHAMNNAGGFIKALPKENNEFAFNFRECIEAKLFSDCLCVSVPLEYGNEHNTYNLYDQFWFFYQYLSGYQILLLQKGIFTRGAITIGSYYSDENIIFSGGLVEAYNLESKVANYPRVIISKKLLDVFKSSDLHNNWDYSQILNIDNTNEVYINPFNYRISTSQLADQILQEMMSKGGIEGLFNDSFQEEDLRDKNVILQEVLAICQNEINTDISDKVKDKYSWIIDFINYELSIDNSREFSQFKV
ncbi:hypothetical protein [Flavobacterium sp. ABG]|uniref:hypothetical protein n=1 Tax=Flavobacterium sp. ABG TaxID=1423322 RepID=UPI00064AEF21|nr:hypothetical protein [Flavobacterium sp. ABG]KLT69620.1 hypothetical protein AB674_11800 [Flavobacterium sp. ABG]